jgi:hypothetical protein
MIWIPGQTDKEKERNKKKRADAQIKALYKRFEMDRENQELEKGNISADQTKLRRQKPLKSIPK